MSKRLSPDMVIVPLSCRVYVGYSDTLKRHKDDKQLLQLALLDCGGKQWRLGPPPLPFPLFFTLFLAMDASVTQFSWLAQAAIGEDSLTWEKDHILPFICYSRNQWQWQGVRHQFNSTDMERQYETSPFLQKNQEWKTFLYVERACVSIHFQAHTLSAEEQEKMSEAESQCSIASLLCSHHWSHLSISVEG